MKRKSKEQKKKEHRRNRANKLAQEGKHARLEAALIEKRLDIAMVSLRNR